MERHKDYGAHMASNPRSFSSTDDTARGFSAENSQ
jgi:hypothetical protein